jgi:hypothetical protein
MGTKDQVESFRQFATVQIDRGGESLSVDELYSLWRARNPTPSEMADSVAKVKAAYAEMQAGDPGVPAREALRRACHDLGLVIDA